MVDTEDMAVMVVDKIVMKNLMLDMMGMTIISIGGHTSLDQNQNKQQGILQYHKTQNHKSTCIIYGVIARFCFDLYYNTK